MKKAVLRELLKRREVKPAEKVEETKPKKRAKKGEK